MLRLNALLVTAATIALTVGSADAAPVKVVTTFSILGDIAQQVGGADTAVTTLVGPGGDAHVYQPTPADARTLAGADLIVVNGLGMEGWIERLIKASGYRGPVIVASTGVKPIKAAEEDHDHDHGHDHGGGKDPHAWQAAPNAKIYADNIAKALSKADPAHAEAYAQRYSAFAAAVDTVDADIRKAMAALPKADRKIVTSHDAFGYYAAAYGVTFLAPVGVSSEAQPSAAQVAKLIRQIKKDHIRAVFVESISDPRLIDQISRETGAKIGDKVFSDALSPADGPASTYLDMMRHNLQAFSAALSPKS